MSDPTTVWRYVGTLARMSMEMFTEEAVPWCETHNSQWWMGRTRCIGRELRNNSDEWCVLEDPPKHWKETG